MVEKGDNRIRVVAKWAGRTEEEGDKDGKVEGELKERNRV